MPLRLNSYVSSTCRGGRPHAAAANRASTQATALVGGDDQLLMISLNADHPGFDDKLVFEEPARRARVNDVLLPQDAGGQAFRRGVGAIADHAAHPEPGFEQRLQVAAAPGD